MLKISRLETRFQEIVFLLTITFSLSIFVGGIFYLKLNPQNFLNATGTLGSSLIESGFRSFGYTYFFIVVFLLHMGHFALATAHQLKDVFRSLPLYARSFAIYFTILLLIASFMTVLESFNGWAGNAHFQFGYGGWFGTQIGGILFRGFGLYGALVILFSLTSAIGISAGYMEIVHSFYVMKDIFKEIFKNLQQYVPMIFREISSQINQFFYQKPEFASQFAPGKHPHSGGNFEFRKQTPSNMPLNQGGRFNTDQFHTPRYSQSTATQWELENFDEGPVENTQLNKQKSVESLKVIVSPEVQEKKTKQKATKKTEEVVVDQKQAVEKKVAEPVEVSPEQKVAQMVEIDAWTKRYKKVDTSLLEKPEKRQKKSDKEIAEICDVLSERLESFGIKGEVIGAHQGVTLTMFEFQPAAGMKLSKIQSLSDDLALVLGAKSIRILTPIPGKTTVGIEVPNKENSILRFSEMIGGCMKIRNMELPIPLGLDVYNSSHVNDLTKMPHLLVSGTTGSGKSVFMNSLISGLIFHKSPKDVRFLMIDPKMIELSPYNGIPHLLRPVVTDVEEAKNLLLWAEREMDKRYHVFAEMQAKNIISFNQAVKNGSKRSVEGRLNKKIDWKFEEMPYIVIVIDELADLMLTQRQEVEKPITRIAQKARAAGIHMVMATQRPSSDIVTGLIKTNFPTRVSFKVSSSIDSRTILDQPGAEKLLGFGDMLYSAQGKAIERLQGAFMTEEEVKKVVQAAASQAPKKRK